MAIAPDLDGCSKEAADSGRISLESWRASLCRVIEAQPGPVVLVAHSRGGIVISEVAESMPERVSNLVYVSGFLLRDGESLLRTLREDGTSPLLGTVSLSEDRSRWLLAMDAVRGMFYGSCSEDDAREAMARLGCEPAAPMMTPLRLTNERFGRVPRTYIECLRDAAIPIGLQRKMCERTSCRIETLDADHAPFLSAPSELTALLLGLER